MRPNIAIVGSGAAGAFAYKACVDYGCAKVEVFTDRMGAPGKGAFYFHWIPDDLSAKYEPDEIMYIGIGTRQKYLAKQWPTQKIDEEFETSYPLKPFTAPGWDASTVWEELWANARVTIVAGKFSDTDLKDLAKFHDIIFLTFPTQESIQEQGKYLVKIPVNLAGKSTQFQLPSKALYHLNKYNNFIMYNGTDVFDWVRLNRLWGYTSFEYSHAVTFSDDDPKITYQQDLMPGTPIWRRMPAHNFMPVGRFARWDRKYLSHQAYSDTKTALVMWDEGYRDFKEII